MRILILILSYNQYPFDKFMQASRNTWDATKHPDIDVRYYHSGEHISDQDIITLCSDEYEMMHYKLKLALEQIDYHAYDFVFRTNSCSYIVKEKLIKVCETLPKTNCYAGYHNGGYISGAGIFFSPDVLDKLLPLLTDTPHGAEDVLIGSLLDMPMTAENSRIDATVDGVQIGDTYHYRFKTSNDNNDRHRDIKHMVELHNELTK